MAILYAMKHLEGLDIDGMTIEELLQTIYMLGDTGLENMSPGYYLDRLEAICLLSEKTQERLRHE